MDAARITRLVALVVIALATMTFVQTGAPGARAGGGCRGTPVTEAAGDTVIMSESCFEPSVLRVEPGRKVTWLNKSSQPHSVAGQNTSWGDYEEMSNGESVAHVFEKAGTYAYYCFVHNGMIGVVVVGDGKGAGEYMTGEHRGRDSRVLASAPQTEPEPQDDPAVVAPTADAGGGADWRALTGVAVVGLVVGGGAVALARRR